MRKIIVFCGIGPGANEKCLVYGMYYFRFADEPPWARRILPSGSLQLLPQNEAEALAAADAAA